MDFRSKLDHALNRPIRALRSELRGKPLLSILDNYQLRIHTAKDDKSNVPDGFIIKWRYVWAQALTNPLVSGPEKNELDFAKIDALTEDIFRTYEVGAVFEPGRERGSEKEFLSRLGLAMKVREPDILGFPEQIKWWATTRLTPFDDSYFVPRFGVTFEQIAEWFEQLIRAEERELNLNINELAAIYRDIRQLQDEFAGSNMSIADARRKGDELKIQERIDSNGRALGAIHIFPKANVSGSLPASAVGLLTTLFGVKPGSMSQDFFYPHDDNPLEFKTFVLLPNSAFYFFDPANAYRIVARTFEREIINDSSLRERYLKNRDRATERAVADRMRAVFPGADIYPNYYLNKGSNEKDLLIRHKDTVILIESKNAKVRAFEGKYSDLLKYQRDFQHSVQYGFDQADEVKKSILGSEEVEFFDEKGRPYFSIKRDEIRRFFIVCITITPRGPFGTDLSYELKKEATEPYPLAVNLLDFDTICKHLSTADKFIGYLDAREKLHGKVRTGDELNFAGYYFKQGNLDLEGVTLLLDDASNVFDREWHRSKGIDVPEPTAAPVRASFRRRGNTIEMRHPSGRMETVQIDPALLAHVTGKPMRKMKGSERNMLCPCGSGVKFKNCCGLR